MFTEGPPEKIIDLLYYEVKGPFPVDYSTITRINSLTLDLLIIEHALKKLTYPGISQSWFIPGRSCYSLIEANPLVYPKTPASFQEFIQEIEKLQWLLDPITLHIPDVLLTQTFTLEELVYFGLPPVLQCLSEEESIGYSKKLAFFRKLSYLKRTLFPIHDLLCHDTHLTIDDILCSFLRYQTFSPELIKIVYSHIVFENYKFVHDFWDRTLLVLCQDYDSTVTVLEQKGKFTEIVMRSTIPIFLKNLQEFFVGLSYEECMVETRGKIKGYTRKYPEVFGVLETGVYQGIFKDVKEIEDNGYRRSITCLLRG